jgi:hypothetical protein
MEFEIVSILLVISAIYLGIGVVITSIALIQPSRWRDYTEICQINSMGEKLVFSLYLILASPAILLLEIWIIFVEP